MPLAEPGECMPLRVWEVADGRFEDGTRAANGMMYHPDAFPLGLIGPVEIMWCTLASSTSTLWIRIHPSIFTEAFDALKEAAAEHIGSSAGVQIRDLREDIGSFEIVGPQGGRLLRRILRICRDEPATKKDVSSVDFPSSR